MGASCPHCGAPAGEAELEAEGQVQRCRACGRSALRSGAPGAIDSGPIATALRDGGAGEAPEAGAPLSTVRRRPAGPGEVPILPAAGLALLATLLFYGALRFVPETRLAELFVERGWVQYAITFVSSWALALLVAKRRRLARERRLLLRDWLARPGSTTPLRPADVDAALAGLASQADFDFDGLLARRLVRALRHFQARRRVVEVVEFLHAEAGADEARIDASYGLIRVFIWAVPTLGFIGTVIGIGAAVGGFSTTLETASSIEGMRESIESVTGGLGVAFDTTLLALVMSMVVMFPSNALQRLEETFLGEVDDYCAEHLVRRLADEPAADAMDSNLERLVERLVAALHRRDGAGG
ncbi:MotA/TolQ/ExbB proton channel family protein [Myxococcota bacterium]|nr:MotA/TolQ/ExbB proton channel family protein [Myxococcota bacterium]